MSQNKISSWEASNIAKALKSTKNRALRNGPKARLARPMKIESSALARLLLR